MKGFGYYWKQKGFKPWFFTSAILVVVLVTVTLLLTLYPLLYQTVNAVIGGERRVLVAGDPSEYIIYENDYGTKEKTLAAANALNEEIAEEGIVMLKNESSLPLKQGSKVTVFGKNSVNLVLGGSGSNSGSKDTSSVRTIYDSLSAAGFNANPAMKQFYEDDSRSGSARPATPPSMGSILTGYPICETPADKYDQGLRSTYEQYNDAAIVVISRVGGEGYDMPRTMFWDGSSYTNWNQNGRQTIPGAKSQDSHYLELDQNECDMLAEACKYFDNVIVVVNSSSPIEYGFLSDPAYENVKGALWIGAPGNSGIMALGRVLNGTVNPSGRTVDTYPLDFTKDPTWANFGNNRTGNGNQYSTVGADGKTTARNAFFVEYEEGIYVGYRYYETRGYTDGEEWYGQNVAYPFGYGLSYTSFDWEVVESSIPEGGELPENGTIDVTVRVTNTGEVAGKDVVQLYYTAPYIDGQIEKAHVVLGDFAKTDMLYPASEANGKDKLQSQELTLSLDVRSMASYDYSDANGNGFKGYELDPGEYTVRLMRNAHEEQASLSYNIKNGYTYPNEVTADGKEGAEINNLFDDVSNHIQKYLSRSDWEGTWPQPVTAEELVVDSALVDALNYRLLDDAGDPWYSDTMPAQQNRELSYNDTKIKLYKLIGRAYDDPMWDELLDQLTVEQMKNMVDVGIYQTYNINNIDKPLTTDADGPMGFALFMGSDTVYGTCYYASECVLGATWNVELAERYGEMVGNEGILGNVKGDGRPYSGWYAPAVNIHRSQFGGRTFEYYSEDGLLSGKMAANVIQGAKSKGVYTYVKHFALNEQETNRDTSGLVTWANEQAMRELYLKPFEIAVKEGETTAMMSSFNRIGTEWAGGCYRLLTTLLREEWGFEGMVITDFNLSRYMNVDQMVRAGGDINLSQMYTTTDATSPTGVTAIRRAAKNILYTVANSNAMNGMGPGVIYRYARPIWWIAMVCVVSAVGVGLIVWGVFTFLSINKRAKNSAPLPAGAQSEANDKDNN